MSDYLGPNIPGVNCSGSIMSVQFILDRENDAGFAQCHILQTRRERERTFYVWRQFGFHLAVLTCPLARSVISHQNKCAKILTRITVFALLGGESDSESVPIVNSIGHPIFLSSD